MIECAATVGETGMAAKACSNGLAGVMRHTLPNRVAPGSNRRLAGLSSVRSRKAVMTGARRKHVAVELPLHLAGLNLIDPDGSRAAGQHQREACRNTEPCAPMMS